MEEDQGSAEEQAKKKQVVDNIRRLRELRPKASEDDAAKEVLKIIDETTDIVAPALQAPTDPEEKRLYEAARAYYDLGYNVSTSGTRTSLRPVGEHTQEDQERIKVVNGYNTSDDSFYDMQTEAVGIAVNEYQRLYVQKELLKTAGGINFGVSPSLSDRDVHINKETEKARKYMAANRLWFKNPNPDEIHNMDPINFIDKAIMDKAGVPQKSN